MLQHSAPKLAIDCIGFLQQSKRYKEICKYIYIYVFGTQLICITATGHYQGEEALQQ
jgi:hypothetical protein